MQLVTASEIKQNSTLLQNALKGDLLVTKRDKPFVVIIDYDRYLELTEKINTKKKKNWIEECAGIMSDEDADKMLEDIYSSRVNKEVDLWS